VITAQGGDPARRPSWRRRRTAGRARSSYAIFRPTAPTADGARRLTRRPRVPPETPLPHRARADRGAEGPNRVSFRRAGVRVARCKATAREAQRHAVGRRARRQARLAAPMPGGSMLAGGARLVGGSDFRASRWCRPLLGLVRPPPPARDLPRASPGVAGCPRRADARGAIANLHGARLRLGVVPGGHRRRSHRPPASSPISRARP
jgi:hypothetical protein